MKLLNKILNSKKNVNEHFNFCDSEISLDKIIEAISSQRNDKSLSNDGLTGESYSSYAFRCI